MALLGGEVQLEGLKGKLGLKIPPQTQNERSFACGVKGYLGPEQAGWRSVRQSLLRIPTGLTPELREKVRQIQEQLEKGR